MFHCIFPKNTKKSTSSPKPNAEQFIPVPQMLAHPIPSTTLEKGKKTPPHEINIVCRILKSSIINNDGSVILDDGTQIKSKVNLSKAVRPKVD